MQRIYPFLWFNDNAQEAVDFYVSIFKGAAVRSIMPGKDKIMGAEFELYGEKFIAINGGASPSAEFVFTPAMSLFVSCKTQKEIDELWEKLSEGGVPQECGWLRDKFGVSWQIVPAVLGPWLMDEDRQRANRVMQAMLKMKKIDIKGLKQAYAG
ncbi:MAG TPA: VOC family protein [Candidatus Paceibacterota bacterium]